MSVVDADHMTLWRAGRAVGAKALGPWTPERTSQILEKVDAGIIGRELLSSVPCPKCAATMTLVRRSVLICEKCKTSVDTEKVFTPQFYQYTARTFYARTQALKALERARLCSKPCRPWLSTDQRRRTSLDTRQARRRGTRPRPRFRTSRAGDALPALGICQDGESV